MTATVSKVWEHRAVIDSNGALVIVEILIITSLPLRDDVVFDTATGFSCEVWTNNIFMSLGNGIFAFV